MDTSANKKMIQDYYVALASTLTGADSGKLARFFSDDITYWIPLSMEELGVSRKMQGKNTILDMVSRTVPNFYITESIQIDFHSLVAEGEMVSAHFTMRAKTVSGKDYENNYLLLFRCEDGRIAECWEYFDTAYWRKFFTE